MLNGELIVVADGAEHTVAAGQTMDFVAGPRHADRNEADEQVRLADGGADADRRVGPPSPGRADHVGRGPRRTPRSFWLRPHGVRGGRPNERARRHTSSVRSMSPKP